MPERFDIKIGDSLYAPDTKREYTRQVFSEIAPAYDFITRTLSFNNDAGWKREMVGQLPPLENPACVDIACGTGDISFLLARKFPDGRIIGMDIASPMLVIAHTRNVFSNVSFVQRDMNDLGLDDASVDIVTGGYALRNAPDLEDLLDEVHRVLKMGGLAAFLDFSKPAKPLLQEVHHWILKSWGSLWGFLLHRNPEVYGYIAESLRLFPDRLRLQKILEEKGFRIITSHLYFGGITESLLIRKVGQ